VIVCLVTDRRHADPIEQARRAAGAGVNLIQVRERDLEALELVEIVHALLAAVAGSATRVIVNDRLDVALAGGAHGVHLRADSIPTAMARVLAPPGFLIGRSVHAAAEAAQAGDDADYLIAGTVFPSSSKGEDRRLLGVDGLQSVVRSAHVPVLAIGGVTADRISDIAACGASGIAAISLFRNPTPDAAAVAAWRSVFDSYRPAS
jgi:thiamine-phosphate diphosphorylase